MAPFKSSLLLSLALLCTEAAAAKFKNIVTFGDSFTDIVNVGDGGVAWPVYAAGYANAKLYPFAKSGGTCSNLITPRPFPSLFESQLPSYLTQKSNGTLGKLPPAETLYTLWLGTNDVGSNALLTGHGLNNASIVDVTKCMVNWTKTLYASGARNFLFQNMVPLQYIPMYSRDSYLSKFWTGERNSTAWSVFMAELVKSGNALSEVLLDAAAPSLPGAHIGYFNSYDLFSDILNRPQLYLNGTAPLNTTGAANACVFQLGGVGGGACSTVSYTDRDSYVWFDELHPSEQVNRVVAKQIADVLQGKKNKWLKWLS